MYDLCVWIESAKSLPKYPFRPCWLHCQLCFSFSFEPWRNGAQFHLFFITAWGHAWPYFRKSWRKFWDHVLLVAGWGNDCSRREKGIRIGEGLASAWVLLSSVSALFLYFPPSLSLSLFMSNTHTHTPWKRARWLMTVWERPQRQQHYREMDRWKGKRREGEKDWNESSNSVRPSSSPLTYWSRSAALWERHPGSDPFCAASSRQNCSFQTTENTHRDFLWKGSERYSVVSSYKQTKVLVCIQCFPPKHGCILEV